MKLYLSFLLLLIFSSCSPPTRDELLMNASCDELKIDYNEQYGYFTVEGKGLKDTITLGENWGYALYRFKQCHQQIASSMSYDDFVKSSEYYLPGGRNSFDAMKKNPADVFNSSEAPAFCDCMDENGQYDASNPNCEKKFQVYRCGFDDSLSWHYSFHRDRCKGDERAVSTFHAYRDTILARASAAEKKMKQMKAYQDSVDNSGPSRQCAGMDFVPRHQRALARNEYRQCKARTSHVSGRCGKHR